MKEFFQPKDFPALPGDGRWRRGGGTVAAGGIPKWAGGMTGARAARRKPLPQLPCHATKDVSAKHSDND